MKKLKQILTYLRNKDITIGYALDEIESIMLTRDEKEQIGITLALMNSMILSGELHSDKTKQQFRDSMNILNNKI